MTTWIDTLRLDRQAHHRQTVAALRRHPLAMDPAEVRRLLAKMLPPADAGPARLTLQQAATEIFSHPCYSRGYAARLARENGLNYHSLCNAICAHRRQPRRERAA